VLAAGLAAALLAGCSSGNDNPTIQGSPTPAATVTGSPSPAVSATASAGVTPTAIPTATVAPVPTVPGPPAPTPTKVAVGTYTTIPAAEAYAQSTAGSTAGTSFQFIGPDVTWRPSATLHVIRATPSDSASYGGDYYFFFVGGKAVGQFYFTGAYSEVAQNATSFSVTYSVYKPGDPHCCPTGGTATTTFRWDGSTLVHDPAPGATMS